MGAPDVDNSVRGGDSDRETTIDFEVPPRELQEKTKACASKEELAELVAKLNFKLTDEQLEAISGGGSCKMHCATFGEICRVNTEVTPLSASRIMDIHGSPPFYKEGEPGVDGHRQRHPFHDCNPR